MYKSRDHISPHCYTNFFPHLTALWCLINLLYHILLRPVPLRNYCHFEPLGCFKDARFDLQLVPQLNPNSNPNLTWVGVQVGSDVWTHFIFKLFRPQLMPQLHPNMWCMWPVISFLVLQHININQHQPGHQPPPTMAATRTQQQGLGTQMRLEPQVYFSHSY